MKRGTGNALPWWASRSAVAAFSTTDNRTREMRGMSAALASHMTNASCAIKFDYSRRIQQNYTGGRAAAEGPP